MTPTASESPNLTLSQENLLLNIYAAMSRDPGDAIDLIQACTDVPLLSELVLVLEMPGTPNTDQALNALFAPIVRKRVANLTGLSAAQVISGSS